MKSKILVFFLMCLSTNIFAIDVSVYPAVFYNEDQGYVEIHYFFSGNTIQWRSVSDSLMNASAEVLITFSQGETIVKFDKYNLKSPSFSEASDFRDLHRYSLRPGKYQVNIKIKDGYRHEDEVTFNTKIIINPSKKIAISDIVLLINHRPSVTDTPYDKYGFHMEALPYNYINKNTSSFVVYAEIYNTDQLLEEQYSLRMQFEQVDGSKALPYESFSKKRTKCKKDIYFENVKAELMPTGDYNLVLEVRSESGEVLARKIVEFHRENPRLNNEVTIEDLNRGRGDFVEKLSLVELDYYLTALIPTLDGRPLDLLQTYFKDKNTDGKKQFLYSHFIEKDPIHPEKHFHAFANLAKQADEAFYSAFGAGFETDRGVIFMRYGAPNDQIKVETEQFALPYEIWVYESLPNNGRGPIKFLFYNKDSAGENYTLLHSNARKERQDRGWKQKLFRRDSLTGFDTANNRTKSREIDDAYNDHPDSSAIRHFQNL